MHFKEARYVMNSSALRSWRSGLRAAACIAFAVVGTGLATALGAQENRDAAPPAARARPEVTVDALSVVRVNSKALANARSSRSLGPQREGTGVVIDSEGLVLTIGYLIIEAETVELSTADGKTYPATVVGYDSATGFGLLKSLRPLPIKPVQIGQSAGIGDRELVLIKVNVDAKARAEVMQITDIFRAKIVDVQPKSLTIEITGNESKVEKFITLMHQFGVVELTRTGKAALPRK